MCCTSLHCRAGAFLMRLRAEMFALLNVGYIQEVRRGVRKEYLKEVLFLKKVPDEVTCGYHGHPGQKQLHRRCHWFYVISDKRSKRIGGHYHEDSWNKDRNFSQPLHTRVTPGKHLK
jgi:hypothetical protein